jgi:hypothetical protein
MTLLESLLTRRSALVLLTAGALCPMAFAADEPLITVTKDPTCGCCTGWVQHLQGAGFITKVVETRDLDTVKARLGVPDDLAACHTAEVAGYGIEGHVPASAIRRLLREKPPAKGLAVPGMPVGSPGMEVQGSPSEEYTVFLFGSFGKRPYARFKEARELSS